jgi:hypothetical protein
LDDLTRSGRGAWQALIVHGNTRRFPGDRSYLAIMYI